MNISDDIIEKIVTDLVEGINKTERGYAEKSGKDVIIDIGAANACDIHQVLKAAITRSLGWKPLEEIDEIPTKDVYHGLLWGRLRVQSGGQIWWTNWKVLKCWWVYWTGSCVNGSARYSDNWFHPSDPPCKVLRIEATHYMPLPEGPKGNLQGQDPQK